MRRLFVAVGLSMLTALPAFAQTGPALILKPWARGQHGGVDASGIFLNSHVKGSNSGFTLATFESAGRFRLQPEMEGGLAAGYDLTYLNIVSGDSLLPDRLVDQSIGLGSNFGEYDGWKVGGSAAAGYAGNNPFADGNAWYMKADLFATTPLSADSQLRIILDYDGNRSLFPDVPLPLVSYMQKVDDNFSYNLGVPYSSLHYRPTDRWTIDVQYYLPVTIDADATYKINDQWSAYGAFENRYFAFHDSAYDGNTRLFFRQRRLEGGVHWRPKAHTMVTLAGGYAFGQRFEKGFQILNTTTVRDIADAPYVRAAVRFTF